MGQCFQVQISGSVGNYGNTWCCFFRCRILGSMDEKTQKTMEVHDTVFSWSLGKLRKYMALCFQVKGKTKEVHGAVFQVQFSSSIGKLWKCMELFLQVQILGGHGKKKTTKEVHGTVFSGSLGKLRKCMALCF